jgi:RHS repeat-associated protein
MSKEVSYGSSGVAVRSIEYSYDLDGKRTRKVSNLGTQDYAYNAQGQLATAGTNGYTYDADGRLSQINKTGQNIDLTHDTFDRLTQVTNNGTTTQYLYDANGNRIREISGGNTKNYLVAPNLGDGLDSTDLVTDGSGNVVSDYVYGGSEIIARLDANGDPLYYLTDSMGSVIGLVDAAGNIQSRIIYDGFGNVVSGDDGSSQGGDFRFQGQWLESESGLYYMRARDYDAETGLFLSRDAVDMQEQGVEAFNPYQFAFGNPLLFSDPTGMFSITEVNATMSIQNTLAGIRTYSVQAAKDRLVTSLYESIGNIVLNALQSVIPGIPRSPLVGTLPVPNIAAAGTWFERLVRDAVCEVLPLPDQLYLAPTINFGGQPENSGFTCAERYNPRFDKPVGGFLKDQTARPDFIVTPPGSRPRRSLGLHGETSVRVDGVHQQPSWLVGDIKLSMKTLVDSYLKPSSPERTQWNAIMNYAAKNALITAGFITLYRGGNSSEIYKNKLVKAATFKPRKNRLYIPGIGVNLLIVNLFSR